MIRPFLAAAALSLASAAAHASFGGSSNTPFSLVLLFSVIAATPGAIAILVVEWLCARRKPQPWMGVVALLAAAYCGLRYVGALGPAGDRVIFVFPIPPLIELALVTFVRAPAVRHAVGWAIPIVAIVVLGLAQGFELPSATKRWNEGWIALFGGALVTTLFWRLGFFLGRRSLRRSSADGGSNAPRAA